MIIRHSSNAARRYLATSACACAGKAATAARPSFLASPSASTSSTRQDADDAFQPARVKTPSSPRKGKGKLTTVEQTKPSRPLLAQDGTIQSADESASRKEAMHKVKQLRTSEANLSNFKELRNYLSQEDRLSDLLVVSRFIRILVFQPRPGAPPFALETIRIALAAAADRDVSTYAKVMLIESPLYGLTHQREWETIEALGRLARQYDLYSHRLQTARMKAAIELGKPRKALTLFETYLKLDQPIAAHYDLVVSAHLQLGDMPAAQAVLREKAERGFEADIDSCISLVRGLRALGGNLEVEESMLCAGKADKAVYGKAFRQSLPLLNAIIRARIDRGDLPRAFALLREMHLGPRNDWPPAIQPYICSLPHWRPSPDATTFALLVRALAASGQVADAIKVFCHSLDGSPAPTSELVSALVFAFMRDAELRGSDSTAITTVERFLADLASGSASVQGRNLPPFEKLDAAYCSLVDQVFHIFGPAEALELIRRSRESAQLSAQTQEMMLERFATHVESLAPATGSSVVTKLAQRIRSRRLPTVKSLNLLLRAVHRLDRVPRRRNAHAINMLRARARQASVSLEKRGLGLSSETVTHMLRDSDAFGSVSTMWDFIQTRLIGRGFKPTVHHFLMIMRAYIRDGNIDGARETIRRAYAMGQSPHIAFYSVLVYGAPRFNRFDIVRECVDAVDRYDLRRDKTYFSALAYAFARRGDTESVDSVIREASAELDLPHLATRDPSFVGMRYRALTKSRNLLGAQQAIKEALDDGLRPDRVILQMLWTTEKYLRRKVNSMNRMDSRPTLKAELKRVTKLNKENLARVKEMLSVRDEDDEKSIKEGVEMVLESRKAKALKD